MNALTDLVRPDEWIAIVMGHMARARDCGWVPEIGQDLERSTISPELVQAVRMLYESSLILSQVCQEATQTAALLGKGSALKARKLMSVKRREELQALGQRLLELDRLIDRLASADGSLRAFAYMSKVLMHNVGGDDLMEVGKESAEAYRQPERRGEAPAGMGQVHAQCRQAGSGGRVGGDPEDRAARSGAFSADLGR